MEKRLRRNWSIALWTSGVFVAISAVAAMRRARIRHEAKEVDAESQGAPELKSSDEASPRGSTLAA